MLVFVPVEKFQVENSNANYWGASGERKSATEGKKIKNSNNFSLLCVPMWNFCDCILCAGVEKFVDIFLGAGARAVAASLCFSFPFYSFIRCMS